MWPEIWCLDHCEVRSRLKDARAQLILVVILRLAYLTSMTKTPSYLIEGTFFNETTPGRLSHGSMCSHVPTAPWLLLRLSTIRPHWRSVDHSIYGLVAFTNFCYARSVSASVVLTWTPVTSTLAFWSIQRIMKLKKVGNDGSPDRLLTELQKIRSSRHAFESGTSSGGKCALISRNILLLCLHLRGSPNGVLPRVKRG